MGCAQRGKARRPNEEKQRLERDAVQMDAVQMFWTNIVCQRNAMREMRSHIWYCRSILKYIVIL
jgi:hypothetical protein